MQDIVARLVAARIVAIVRLERYDRAIEVAQALYDGGITAIEFTLTGSGANEAITATRVALGEKVLVGVGTVLSAQAAHEAIDAGSQFAVTPALRPEVIAVCKQRNVPVLCGAFTPSEALMAHELGAAMIKIFPARSLGPGYIKDLLAPLPFLKLVPTGGVGPENARSYLDAGAAAVGIGGNLVSARAVAASDWATISAAARACVAALA
jgi:2-dehydro-3-deoxyphosphogluconate aldolase/(4S)-4-hydroxy-2-oxoglutarate aldolase